MKEPLAFKMRAVNESDTANSPMTIEQLIEFYFKKEGLNQSEIGRRIGVNSSVLSRYFRGENEVRAEVFVQLLTLMGINLREIIEAKIEPQEVKVARPEGLGSHINELLEAVDPLTKKALLSSLIATLSSVGSTQKIINESETLTESFEALREARDNVKTVKRKSSSF